MSLLGDAYKSYKGLVGYDPKPEPQPTRYQLAQAYAQRSAKPTSGVMNASVEYPVDVHHKGLSETFGENVHQTPRLLGTPSIWKEFGEQTSKTFEELGLKVDKKRLFPAPVHLTSSEGRDIPYGDAMQGRDYHEQQWLEKDRLANISPYYKNTSDWQLAPLHSTNEGLLNAYGLFRRSIDSANPGLGLDDNSYIGIARRGAKESRGHLVPAQAPNFEEHYIRPRRSTPWHEYAHYLDVWAGGSSGSSLSRIATTLDLSPYSSPHRDLTAQDHYEAWMNDPRTAHLDVVDKINTVDHPNQKLNNPREILGKLYVTAMLNPTRADGTYFDPSSGAPHNMEENIARAIGTYLNPDAEEDEGHIKGIKDMRKDVMGAFANLLNQ